MKFRKPFYLLKRLLFSHVIFYHHFLLRPECTEVPISTNCCHNHATMASEITKHTTNYPTEFDPADIVRYPHPFLYGPNYDDAAKFLDPPETPHDMQTVFDGTSWIYTAIRNTLEMSLMSVSSSIRHKPNWYEKIDDSEIVAKWRAEADAQDVSSTAMQYILAELQHFKKIAESSEFKYERSPVDGVWQSDRMISDELKSQINHAFNRLREEEPVDWHPGSENLVRDIVHPSLYPLVVNKTKVLETSTLSGPKSLLGKIGCGEVIKDIVQPGHEDEDVIDENYISKKFQWLPAEVDVDLSGKAIFFSYVNNLHPVRYAEVYNSLEKIIELFIPMFERVLGDLLSPIRRPSSIEYDEMDLDLINAKLREQGHDPEQYDDDKFNAADAATRKSTREVEPFNEYRKVNVSLLGKRLQIIVKLASIELSDEHPKYSGGKWHVEGCNNERIVATGLYYASVENISKSKLSFREAVNEPPLYAQNDEVGTKKVYGFQREEQLHQNIGYVEAEGGRCIAFPNVSSTKSSRLSASMRRRADVEILSRSSSSTLRNPFCPLHVFHRSS